MLTADFAYVAARGPAAVSAVETDAAGFVYIAGTYTDTVQFGPSAASSTPTELSSRGLHDIFVAKYNPGDGQVLWVKSLGNSSDVFNVDLDVDYLGNVTLIGSLSGTIVVQTPTPTSLTGPGALIVRMNNGGDFIWAKRLDVYAAQVAVDEFSTVYITGRYDGTVDFDPNAGTSTLTGEDAAYVLHLNTNGSLGWVREFRSIDSEALSEGIALDTDASRNVYVAGIFSGSVDVDPDPNNDVIYTDAGSASFIVKLSASGDYVWSHRFAFATTFRSIAVIGTSVYAAGEFEYSSDFNPTSGVDSRTSAGQSDAFVLNLRTDGTYGWVRTWGSTRAEFAEDISADNAGAVYIVGNFSGTVDFDPSTLTASRTSVGNNDNAALKFDSAGNFVWVRTWGGGVWHGARGVAIGNGGAGGDVYTVGNFQGVVDFNPGAAVNNRTANAKGSYFLSKLTQQSTSYRRAHRLGGASNEQINAVAVDSAGNQYVAGTFGGTVDFDPSLSTVSLTSAGAQDLFVAKYSPTGALIWAKRFGNTGIAEVAFGLVLDALGNPILTGHFSGTVDFDPGSGVANLSSGSRSTSGYNGFILKLTAAGSYAWARSITTQANARGSALATDAAGNVFVTGRFASTATFSSGSNGSPITIASKGSDDAFISKYNSTGARLWTKAIGGTQADEGTGIAVASSGGVYTVGNFSGTADFNPSSTATKNLTSKGSSDAFISQLTSSAGDYVFGGQLGGTGGDTANGVAADSSGVHIVGSFSGTADFNPSTTGTTNLASSGSIDAYVLKLSLACGYLWAQKAGGAGAQRATDIVLGPRGEVNIYGELEGTADFNPSSTATANLTSAGSFDPFIWRLSSAGAYIAAQRIGGAQDDLLGGIAIGPSGASLYVTGAFVGTADVNPTSDATTTLTSAGGLDGFLVTLVL